MMLWLFFGSSFAVALITGFASPHGGLLAQVIQGLSKRPFFLLAVLAAFSFYGWKIGLLDLPVVLTAANVGVSLFQSREEIRGTFNRRSSYRLGRRDDSF